MASKGSLTVSHEDFLTDDKRTISTQKIIFAIWKYRTDVSFVNALANILSFYVTEKRVFYDIEFYLPQLMHLIIHINVDFSNDALESLAMLICKTSFHVALQITFILVAAMEDYQPEDTKGKLNPNRNVFLFFRCVRLLQYVEHAVIYGTTALNETEAQRLKQEAESAVARFEEPSTPAAFPSESSVSASTTAGRPTVSGVLRYKRNEKKSIFYAKIWKPRYFVIVDRVLFCYHDQGDEIPLRAFPLTNECEAVHVSNKEKNEFEFEVSNPSTNMVYHLRAESKAQLDLWLEALNWEINLSTSDGSQSVTASPVAGTPSSSSSKGMIRMMSSALHAREQSMTPGQINKWKMFHQQRAFITVLTDMCEKLRFLDRDVRKQYLKRYLAELAVPPFVYLPLCSSLDPYAYVISPVVNEAHAFTTKARCPALMLFELEEHPEGLDYASFLATDVMDYEEKEVVSNKRLSFRASIESAKVDPSNATTATAVQVGAVPSKFKSTDKEYMEIWEPEGSGSRKILDGFGAHSGARVATARMSVSVAASNPIPASPPPPPATATDSSGRVGPLMNKELQRVKSERIRAQSRNGHHQGWRIDGLIAKSNDDVRQEVFVMQMIKYFKKIFTQKNVPVWVYTYRILSTTKSTGLIQLIPDAVSLDGLKKSDGYPGSLGKYFELVYGNVTADGAKPEGPKYVAAVCEYVKSMAAYSVVAYLLAIKDRHNGNVMLDAEGHVIHIDFGFVFGLAPGKAFSMEKAPFKLTEELAQVMGGPKSAYFAEFKKLMVECFLAARDHAEDLCTMLEIMRFQSNYPAFRYNANAISDFRLRLHLEVAEKDVPKLVDRLVAQSYKHSGTDFYDQFQLLTNGIAP